MLGFVIKLTNFSNTNTFKNRNSFTNFYRLCRVGHWHYSMYRPANSILELFLNTDTEVREIIAGDNEGHVLFTISSQLYQILRKLGSPDRSSSD